MVARPYSVAIAKMCSETMAVEMGGPHMGGPMWPSPSLVLAVPDICPERELGVLLPRSGALPASLSSKRAWGGGSESLAL